ncbi:MAG: copper homeostasis membrane protein CopD [Alphaproteobacteria bacterium]
MLEGLQIAARFGQYAALLTLFGVCGFGLLSTGAASYLPMRRLLGAGVIMGLAATLFGLVAQTGEMAGSLGDAVKSDMLWTIISATHYGAAWIVRLVALVLAALAIRLTDIWPRMAFGLTLILAGLAVASLAWGGHGAGGEGLAGLGHLSADVAHLWAAGLWVGALVCFCLLALTPGKHHLKPAARALAKFAGLGSAIAGTLVLTGAINTAFLVPLRTLAILPDSSWARVLALKLALFAGMLALAATNRFVLTPRLTNSLADPSREAEAVRGLRFSLLAETTLAFCVLGLVAWLGMLHPPSHSAG